MLAPILVREIASDAARVLPLGRLLLLYSGITGEIPGGLEGV